MILTIKYDITKQNVFSLPDEARKIPSKDRADTTEVVDVDRGRLVDLFTLQIDDGLMKTSSSPSSP